MNQKYLSQVLILWNQLKQHLFFELAVFPASEIPYEIMIHFLHPSLAMSVLTNTHCLMYARIFFTWKRLHSGNLLQPVSLPKLLSLLKDQSFSRTSPVFSFGYNLFSFSCSWRVLPKDYIYMVVWLSSWCQLVHGMLLTHLVCTHIWCDFAFQAPSYCFSLVSWYNSKPVINCWEFQSSFLNSLMFIFSHINISIIRATWLSGTPWQGGLELVDLYSPF